jgi:PAS domain S-box-containing protein
VIPRSRDEAVASGRAGARPAWERWRLVLLAAMTLLVVVVPMMMMRQKSADVVAAAELVNRSNFLKADLARLIADVRDVEAAALTVSQGVDTPLVRTRLREARADIPTTLARITLLTRNNPEQQVRIGTLQAMLQGRLALAQTIATAGEPERVRQELRELVTRYPIADVTEAMIADEESRLRRRTAAAAYRRNQLDTASIGAMLAQLGLLGFIAFFWLRQLRARGLAERESLAANARALSVLQTVREPIVLVDAAQRVIMHNAAFSELYGVGDQDARGTALADLGDGAWRDGALTQRLNDVLLRGRELWDFEQRQRTPDGQQRTMLINGRRMPPGADNERMALLTVSDVTARKAAEESVLELNRQLRGKVAQVSEVNEELEAFSYSVSHDLRAPLRHIGGFADKLGRHLGDEADEKARHYLEVIGSSARRMSTLIDDLLVYSRLGRSALRLQAVDQQSLVAETRALLDANAQADTPGRRIEWRIAPLPILIADENMMRQVWLNLLGNAVKYTGKRELATIEVGHRRLDDGSHEFSVRDNGTGFDMAYAGKLFGVFQRMHKASEFPGTGIGLASVRRVLARHGGQIWAESTPGAGSTFLFTLPAALDTPNPTGIPA